VVAINQSCRLRNAQARLVVSHIHVVLDIFRRGHCTLCVTNPPCPSSKQVNDSSVAALKRHACDFGDQQTTGDDDAGISYLESMDNYEYDMLAIGRMIIN
jgi:hypothetical protein